MLNKVCYGVTGDDYDIGKRNCQIYIEEIEKAKKSK
jgi:hypothetical protein